MTIVDDVYDQLRNYRGALDESIADRMTRGLQTTILQTGRYHRVVHVFGGHVPGPGDAAACGSLFVAGAPSACPGSIPCHRCIEVLGIVP